MTVAVGVPPRAPLALLNVMPAGSVPAVSAQVYGAVPPVAASVALYGAPTWPFGSEVVVTASAGTTVRVSCAWLVCAGLLESLTWKVSGVPATAASGVPPSAPLAVSRVMPEGSVPAASDQEYGAVPPVAASVAL